jgi:hypothetical protein
MNVDTTKNLTCAFCTTDGGTTITVEKCRYAAECFSTKLETDNRARIGFETWGDNSAKGDIKVDNKVANNLGDDTVKDTVKHPQIRTRTTPPYNTRTRSVQHPYKRRRRLDEVMRGSVLEHDSLTKLLREKFSETFVVAYNFVASRHGMELQNEQRGNG